MNHYLEHMVKIYVNVVADIEKNHADWKIDNRFTIYREITPVLEDVSFHTTLYLKKRIRTSVIFMQEFNGRKSKLYFSEYNIIETLIKVYDQFVDEGDTIYQEMFKLIEDNGTDVSFKIGTDQFTFKGIQYLHNNKIFLTFADYEIGINDFIGLLNLVIEKDRYSKESENGKGTILKYIVFLLLCSKRTALKQKTQMIKILTESNLYRDTTLYKYKDVINKTGEFKLYFKSELFNNII